MPQKISLLGTYGGNVGTTRIGLRSTYPLIIQLDQVQAKYIAF